ncbi:MmcQ/YjbR family DNA-binding protein [soil metagenome]
MLGRLANVDAVPHPIMFRDDDLGLAELRRIALGFPGATEKISHGRPVFGAPKMFAVYGGSSKRTAPGEMTPFPHAMLVKVDETDAKALEQDTRCFFPAYLGPYGWLGLDFTAAAVDWAEVAELVDASYRLIASKKLLKQLDEQVTGAI